MISVFEQEKTLHTSDRAATVIGPTALLVKVKVKLSLCLTNYALHHEGIWWRWRYSSTLFTSALDGGEWSRSRPGRFTPEKRAPDAHWAGGWVDPRACLDAGE
jgi:hypothetical protein